MSVVRLVRRSNKETVETLEWMLQEARRGKLSDFLGSFRDEDGQHYTAYTGLYRADSSKALKAVMRMSVALMNAHDAVFGAP